MYDRRSDRLTRPPNTGHTAHKATQQAWPNGSRRKNDAKMSTDSNPDPDKELSCKNSLFLTPQPIFSFTKVYL